MTVNLYDAPAYPLQGASKERFIGSVTFTIGAAGAISATSSDDAQIAGNTFLNGVCSLTYPACSAVRIKGAIVGDGTVKEVVVTAASASAGTATVKTTASGVAASPNNGARIMLGIWGTV